MPPLSNEKIEKLRSFFNWQYSGVIIPFMWAGGIAMLGIASALEYRGGLYILTDIFFLISFLWSIGYWLTSDFLHKKIRNIGVEQKKDIQMKLKKFIFIYGNME